MLLLLYRAVAEPNPTAQTTPLSAVPFRARADAYKVLQGEGLET